MKHRFSILPGPPANSREHNAYNQVVTPSRCLTCLKEISLSTLYYDVEEKSLTYGIMLFNGRVCSIACGDIYVLRRM